MQSPLDRKQKDFLKGRLHSGSAFRMFMDIQMVLFYNPLFLHTESTYCLYEDILVLVLKLT